MLTTESLKTLPTPWADRSKENVNPVELALFRTTPSAPAAKVRFARHVLEQNADSIWPRLMLAHHAPTRSERSCWLCDACQVGQRLWQPWLSGEQTIEWWADERTQPFMMAIASYGTLSMELGDSTQASHCLRLLLEMDPGDSLGAVDLFTKAGLVHQCSASEAPGRRM